MFSRHTLPVSLLVACFLVLSFASWSSVSAAYTVIHLYTPSNPPPSGASITVPLNCTFAELLLVGAGGDGAAVSFGELIHSSGSGGAAGAVHGYFYNPIGGTILASNIVIGSRYNGPLPLHNIGGPGDPSSMLVYSPPVSGVPHSILVSAYGGKNPGLNVGAPAGVEIGGEGGAATFTDLTVFQSGFSAGGSNAGTPCTRGADGQYHGAIWLQYPGGPQVLELSVRGGQQGSGGGQRDPLTGSYCPPGSPYHAPGYPSQDGSSNLDSINAYCGLPFQGGAGGPATFPDVFTYSLGGDAKSVWNVSDDPTLRDGQHGGGGAGNAGMPVACATILTTSVRNLPTRGGHGALFVRFIID